MGGRAGAQRKGTVAGSQGSSVPLGSEHGAGQVGRGLKVDFHPSWSCIALEGSACGGPDELWALASRGHCSCTGARRK